MHGTEQQSTRRVLPPTPGKALDASPPSKPQRVKKQGYCEPLPKHELPASDCDLLKEGIRPRLQRIAAEISARLVGYEGRKPPPPYEQVGNSIAYQLLHQQRKMITSELIDALYPALKENELKDSSLLQSYSSFLQSFKLALEMPASVQCTLPADLPTCDFVVDMLLHLCCMPHMTALAEKQGELWCQLLALFSLSEQNQHHMAFKRHPSKVLSCMHLNIMSLKVRFQQHGWTVLGNTVSVATPSGGKPVLSESSLTLALALIDCQLTANSSDIELVGAIVNFLAVVATTAKKSAIQNNSDHQVYTKEQATRVLSLFREKFVLRQVMKVPPHLRSDGCFEQAYSSLVKALVPVRGQATGTVKASSTTSVPKQSQDELLAITAKKDISSPIESNEQQLRSTSCIDMGAESSDQDNSLTMATEAEGFKSSSCSNLIGSNKVDKVSLRCSDSMPHLKRGAVGNDTPSDYSDSVAGDTTEQPALSLGDSVTTQNTSIPENRVSPTQTHPENVVSPPLSPSTANLVSPPLSPNTANLVTDVQELLDILKAPLETVNTSTIKIPKLSRNNHYYRHSFKRTTSISRKGAPAEGGTNTNNEDCVDPIPGSGKSRSLWTDVPPGPSGSGKSRSLWTDVPPGRSLLNQDKSDLFEVSGKYLSSRHAALEEVVSDHEDVYFALQVRLELLTAVSALWAKGKGLQAVTNLLQGCFSKNAGDDMVLFVDSLQFFLSHQSPWTLAVCLVLLPTLRQLIAAHLHKRSWDVISSVILMIVHRFSDLILMCKATGKTCTSKLSSLVDHEQQLVCYKELHGIQHVLHQQMDTDQNSSDTAQKLYTALKPFQ